MQSEVSLSPQEKEQKVVREHESEVRKQKIEYYAAEIKRINEAIKTKRQNNRGNQPLPTRDS